MANQRRADKAARRQMNAVPADPKAETTLGPDSVIAALTLDQQAIGSDGMAETLDGYTDEVANISEALADDKLSTGGAGALRTALARSKATLAKIDTAFRGGE